MTKSEILCEWLCEEYCLYHCDFEYESEWINCKELEITYKYIGDYGIKTYDGRRIYSTRQLKKYLKGSKMKEFKQLSRKESIKKIAEYFNTQNFKTVGIVFEKQKDATAFLDEVKQFLNKEDFEVWNKKSIESNTNVIVITDNCRYPQRLLSGWTCSKLFIEQKCLEKYSSYIYNGCICPQCALNSDEVENYLIVG